MPPQATPLFFPEQERRPNFTMEKSSDHIIIENEDIANSRPIAASNLDNMPSGHNDYMTNSIQQPLQPTRKLFSIAPERPINLMVVFSSPILNSAPNFHSTAAELPSSMDTKAFASPMSSNSETKGFKFSAVASNFTPSSHLRRGGPRNSFHAPATRGFNNGQEALPMTSFQGQSSRDRRPTSWFQTREYHEGHLRNNDQTRAESSPPVVSSSLYRPQYSLLASNQNSEPPSSETQTLMPLQEAGLHADLQQSQPLLPAITQDGVLSQAIDVQSSSSQTRLQVPKITCKTCKWPSTFDDVEYVLPLPASPPPSQAWLHHQSCGLPHSYLGHFKSGLTAGNDDNTEIDHAESNFPPVSQDDLISTDVKENIDFVARTNGTAGNTPDDREFLRNRIRNIQQWWEHALTGEVDRLTKQLNQALAESDERKTQLSTAQEEIKKLKETEMSKGLDKVSELEATEKRSLECKLQERQVRCLEVTETGEEYDKLQTENDQLQAQNEKLRNENAKLQEALDQTTQGAFEALQTRNTADNAPDDLHTLLTTRGRRLIRRGQVAPSSSSSSPSASLCLSIDSMGGLAFPSESMTPPRQSSKPKPTPQPRERLEPTGRDEYM